MDESVIQQGYLQYVSNEGVKKVFAILNNHSLLCYAEDPAIQESYPVVAFNLSDSRILENTNSRRPKTFAISSSDEPYAEFICPTNSVKFQWVKQIMDTSSKSESYVEAPKTLTTHQVSVLQPQISSSSKLLLARSSAMKLLAPTPKPLYNTDLLDTLVTSVASEKQNSGRGYVVQDEMIDKALPRNLVVPPVGMF